MQQDTVIVTDNAYQMVTTVKKNCHAAIQMYSCFGQYSGHGLSNEKLSLHSSSTYSIKLFYKFSGQMKAYSVAL